MVDLHLTNLENTLKNRSEFLTELEVLYRKYGIIVTSYEGEYLQEADDVEIEDTMKYLELYG